MWPQLLLPCTLHHSHSQFCEAMRTFCHLWDFTRVVPTAGRLVTASSQLHLASFSSFRSSPLGRLPWTLPISNWLRLSSPSPVMELVMSCLVVPPLCLSVSPTTKKVPWKKGLESSLPVPSRCLSHSGTKVLNGWKKKLSCKVFMVYGFYNLLLTWLGLKSSSSQANEKTSHSLGQNICKRHIW